MCSFIVPSNVHTSFTFGRLVIVIARSANYCIRVKEYKTHIHMHSTQNQISYSIAHITLKGIFQRGLLFKNKCLHASRCSMKINPHKWRFVQYAIQIIIVDVTVSIARKQVCLLLQYLEFAFTQQGSLSLPTSALTWGVQ